MAEILAQGLGKTHGDHVVVHDLSFRVSPGRITGFIGPNGSGKSSTIRLMLGLDTGEGRTTFDGVPYAGLTRPATRVGALLDTPALHPGRRIRDHLRMVATGAQLPRDRVDAVLELVGLTKEAGLRPRGFSLGMRQRLGIATALLGDPDTLILDEPSNGLDPQGIEWLRRFLRDFAARGNAVFVSSHLLAAMASLADDVVVIGRGRLLGASSVEDFVRRLGAPAVAARSADTAGLVAALRADALQVPGAAVHVEPDGTVVATGVDARRVAVTAAAAGVLLHHLSDRTPSLEQAYLTVSAPAVEHVGRSPEEVLS